jgi:hypothetical protein
MWAKPSSPCLFLLHTVCPALPRGTVSTFEHVQCLEFFCGGHGHQWRLCVQWGLCVGWGCPFQSTRVHGGAVYEVVWRGKGARRSTACNPPCATGHDGPPTVHTCKLTSYTGHYCRVEGFRTRQTQRAKSSSSSCSKCPLTPTASGITSCTNRALRGSS